MAVQRRKSYRRQRLAGDKPGLSGSGQENNEVLSFGTRYGVPQILIQIDMEKQFPLFEQSCSIQTPVLINSVRPQEIGQESTPEA